MPLKNFEYLSFLNNVKFKLQNYYNKSFTKYRKIKQQKTNLVYITNCILKIHLYRNSTNNT